MGDKRLQQYFLSRRFLSISLGIVLAFSWPGMLPAQVTTADIVGTVTDPAGAVVPGATVTLTQVDRKDVRTIQTNGVGEFTFSLLQNGT